MTPVSGGICLDELAYGTYWIARIKKFAPLILYRLHFKIRFLKSPHPNPLQQEREHGYRILMCDEYIHLAGSFA